MSDRPPSNHPDREPSSNNVIASGIRRTPVRSSPAGSGGVCAVRLRPRARVQRALSPHSAVHGTDTGDVHRRARRRGRRVPAVLPNTGTDNTPTRRTPWRPVHAGAGTVRREWLSRLHRRADAIAGGLLLPHAHRARRTSDMPTGTRRHRAFHRLPTRRTPRRVPPRRVRAVHGTGRAVVRPDLATAAPSHPVVTHTAGTGRDHWLCCWLCWACCACCPPSSPLRERLGTGAGYCSHTAVTACWCNRAISSSACCAACCTWLSCCSLMRRFSTGQLCDLEHTIPSGSPGHPSAGGEFRHAERAFVHTREECDDGTRRT